MSVAAAQDFALIRPILDTLLLSPVVSSQRSEGFSRAVSAPLQETKLVRMRSLRLLLISCPCRFVVLVLEIAMSVDSQSFLAVPCFSHSLDSKSFAYDKTPMSLCCHPVCGQHLNRVYASQDDEAAVVKETKPLQSARFNGYIKAGIDHVEAFALLSNKDAADFFDLVLQGVRRGEEARTAAELFVKEMWYSVCLQ
jgi:hypothetical protein